MLKEIRSLLSIAISSLEAEGKFLSKDAPAFRVEHTRKKGHGDLASNVALVLAKHVGTSPQRLAEQIVQHFPLSPLIKHTEIAGPGFINFFLAPEAWARLIQNIRAAADSYGNSNIGAGERVLVEFVSSNPTGPLHVGHGRGAAYGDALVRVLRAAGYATESEYYINDAGRQMDILALSIWLRYLELCGETVQFPEGTYQGDYIFDIAVTLHREDGTAHHHSAAEVMESLPTEIEASIDLLIGRMKNCVQKKGFSRIQDLGSTALVADIQEDLAHLGVEFDTWFSEKSLVVSGTLDRMVAKLRDNGHLYEKEDAWWFRSSDFGDEKDRVVIRANKNHTYFASDIAYHMDKLDRGFNQLINIWGADHHGYISRMKAVIAALNRDPDRLTVLVVQFAALYKGGKRVAMSTRSGDFVTLRQLRQEVGADAARFFYVLRKPEQHMDFDLDLAKSQSNDNPVYYVQYAHARICSVFRQLAERGIDIDLRKADLGLLVEVQELDLLRSLLRYPDVVAQAARNYEPHQVAYFARELANDFHAYYNAHPFIGAEEHWRLARLSLIDSTRQVLANALGLLGVSAPQSM
jgi:arginyl-tRNA synthetase